MTQSSRPPQQRILRVRVPAPLLAVIDASAHASGQTRSAVARQMLLLASGGLPVPATGFGHE